MPGGSEKVVLALLEILPAAELFVSVYDPAPWPALITERPVHASFLNRIPGARTQYAKLLPLMDRAFRSFDLSGFDLIVSSNHACAKNVRTPPGAVHVCYCHTPMRYVWEPSFLLGERLGRARSARVPGQPAVAAPRGPQGRSPAGRVPRQLHRRGRAHRASLRAILGGHPSARRAHALPGASPHRRLGCSVSRLRPGRALQARGSRGRRLRAAGAARARRGRGARHGARARSRRSQHHIPRPRAGR